MSGYPGAACSGNQVGYPGSVPPSSGYSSQPPSASNGYPGSALNQGSGGYPGNVPSQDINSGAHLTNFGTPEGHAVDPNIAQWFHAVDVDKNGHISAKELQGALVNSDKSHFSDEACKMMIEMFDRNRIGSININEFSDLFKYINQWKATFEGMDRDRTGYIEFNELTQAFQQMGYRFTPTFVQNLLVKYDHRTRRLTLDNFIVSCVYIKRLTDGFRTRDHAMQGQVMMQYEDFIGLAMGVHQ